MNLAGGQQERWRNDKSPRLLMCWPRITRRYVMPCQTQCAYVSQHLSVFNKGSVRGSLSGHHVMLCWVKCVCQQCHAASDGECTRTCASQRHPVSCCVRRYVRVSVSFRSRCPQCCSVPVPAVLEQMVLTVCVFSSGPAPKYPRKKDILRRLGSEVWIQSVQCTSLNFETLYNAPIQ